MSERYSVTVLQKCIDLQNKKANDYQNPNSTIRQADYYPSGCQSILDTMQAKVLRMRSVMEAMQYDTSYQPNFESLEDSAMDLINYASFFCAFAAGKMDGQKPDRDFLNRKKKEAFVTGMSAADTTHDKTHVPDGIRVTVCLDNKAIGTLSFNNVPDQQKLEEAVRINFAGYLDERGMDTVFYNPELQVATIIQQGTSYTLNPGGSEK